MGKSALLAIKGSHRRSQEASPHSSTLPQPDGHLPPALDDSIEPIRDFDRISHLNLGSILFLGCISYSRVE